MLQARRTDKDFFAGSISSEMFQYLEYSRFAFTDITGLNANVFYELGARHRARESGTVIFRQADAPIPFDIGQIKAFSYEYESEEGIKKSRELITRVLKESLEQNRLDSPIQAVLKIQQQFEQPIEEFLREAENAIRNFDETTAIDQYHKALQIRPNNPLLHLKLGLRYKATEKWDEARKEFLTAAHQEPGLSDAWRELGIAENKLYKQRKTGPTGQESLEKAIALNPRDYDAHASLGGVLKRLGEYPKAYEAYHRATEISEGHTYPLLNEMKLKASLDGRFDIDAAQRLRLAQGARRLKTQVSQEPPYDPPWSFFDLAEIHLYLGQRDEFLRWLDEGVLFAKAGQAQTFRDSLDLLRQKGITVDSLDEGIARLDQTIEALKPRG